MSDHSSIQAAAVDRVIWRRDLPHYIGHQVATRDVRAWISLGYLPTPDINMSRITMGWRLSTLTRAGFLPGITEPPPKGPKPYQVQPRCFHLYRHFDHDGILLYVGQSLSAVSRLVEHRRSSPWLWSVTRVEIERHPTRQAALEAERKAIQEEAPLFNVVHARRKK